MLVLALWASGCATGPFARGPDHCVPRFALEDGWLGGDAVYSVPLLGDSPEARRTLWLFGDTFVREDREDDARTREGATFVHNSVAISVCEGGRFEIVYAWGEGADGEPRAFFDRADASSTSTHFYWPLDGFLHGGRLFVLLLEVESAAPQPPLMMPFSLRGMALARIDEPDSPPSLWRPRILRLSRSASAFPGAAVVVEGEHVLLFGFVGAGVARTARFLARLPLAALDAGHDDLEPHLETWTGSDGWQPGLLPERAAILMPDSSTEMSVSYHPELPPERRWLAIYGSPLQVAGDGRGEFAPSGGIYARTAPRPEGPWSERLLVHAIDEVGASGRRGERGTICYAAKEHPEFAAPGELLITYVCNVVPSPGEDGATALRRLQTDLRVYIPRVVRVDLPEALRKQPDE